jgi:drug/metabolite transporter (DMT)-like permease
VASVPSFFVPAKPPTPPSASSSLPKTELLESLKSLGNNLSFWLIFIPFSVYVGFFNAASSLINQILSPYNYSETQAGIAGGLLILVGLVTAAITSPILDRTHAYLFAVRWLSPLVGLSYLAFVWAPQTRTLAAPFVILSILGASSFALVPAALEYLVEITFPASPEVTSVICWAAGQLTGGVFIVIMNALKDGNNANPPQNMYRALVFQAVLCMVVAPLPQLLGRKFMGLGEDQRRRFLVDEAGETREQEPERREEAA